MEKRNTNFGQKYVIGETYNQDRYGHVYIFLIRKKKENFFEKCVSVRPSSRTGKDN